MNYGNFTPGFIDALAKIIGNRSVLEVYAGNGFLAKSLRERGVQIYPTSLFSSHDGHQLGMYCEVAESSSFEAVYRQGDQFDVLLMSWPITDFSTFFCSKAWLRKEQISRPIIFIGELPGSFLGYSNMLSGCACDNFFASIADMTLIEEYEPRNILDRAAILKVSKEKVADQEKLLFRGTAQRNRALQEG